MRFLHFCARSDGQKFKIQPILNHQIAAGGLEWNAARRILNRFIYFTPSAVAAKWSNKRDHHYWLVRLNSWGSRWEKLFFPINFSRPPSRDDIAISVGQVELRVECKFWYNVKFVGCGPSLKIVTVPGSMIIPLANLAGIILSYQPICVLAPH